jgi:hypothetical protein
VIPFGWYRRDGKQSPQRLSSSLLKWAMREALRTRQVTGFVGQLKPEDAIFFKLRFR